MRWACIILALMSAICIDAQQTNRFAISYRQDEWTEGTGKPVFTSDGDLWGTVALADPITSKEAYALLKADIVKLDLSEVASNPGTRAVTVTKRFSAFGHEFAEVVYKYDESGVLIEESHQASLGPMSPPWSKKYYYLDDGRKISVRKDMNSAFGSGYAVEISVPVDASIYKVSSYDIYSSDSIIAFRELAQKFNPKKDYDAHAGDVYEDYAAVVTNPALIANGTVSLDALGLRKPATWMEYDWHSAPKAIGSRDLVVVRYDRDKILSEANEAKKELQKFLDGSRSLEDYESDPSAFIPNVFDDNTLDLFSRLYFKLSNKYYATDRARAMAYLNRAFMFLKDNRQHVSLTEVYYYGMSGLMDRNQTGEARWMPEVTEQLKAVAAGDQRTLARYIVYNFACLAALQGLGQPAEVFLIAAKEMGFPDFAKYVKNDKDLAVMFSRRELEAISGASLQGLSLLMTPKTRSISVP